MMDHQVCRDHSQIKKVRVEPYIFWMTGIHPIADALSDAVELNPGLDEVRLVFVIVRAEFRAQHLDLKRDRQIAVKVALAIAHERLTVAAPITTGKRSLGIKIEHAIGVGDLYPSVPGGLYLS